MYEPTGRQDPRLAFMWPAFAAASTSDFAALVAKRLVSLALGADHAPEAREPGWATPNTVALELKSVRLRDFSTAEEGAATLLCAPFALHRAMIADLAPGHSLVAALREAGLRRLFVTDWRSATPDMRLMGVDDYLAALNVLVDQLGGSVNLVGLCQGGWMSLLYAARFPAKVRKLVLVGAPVDIAAGQSALSAIADASPLALFDELVKFGDGRVLGRKVLTFWGAEMLSSREIRDLLQTPEPIGSPAFAALEATFRQWHVTTLDLPGTYYLEVIDKLYKRNEIAAGRFVALGERVDLAKVRVPLFLLAARDDELVAPAQLFAAENLVGTPARDVRKALAPCNHGGLFMGRTILSDFWPRIARWMIDAESENVAPAAA
jgi:poly(3-hydroxybutyrate) depolymerase